MLKPHLYRLSLPNETNGLLVTLFSSPALHMVHRFYCLHYAKLRTTARRCEMPMSTKAPIAVSFERREWETSKAFNSIFTKEKDSRS